MGAESLQFEPYWYLFENGEPNENLKTLMATLTWRVLEVDSVPFLDSFRFDQN